MLVLANLLSVRINGKLVIVGCIYNPISTNYKSLRVSENILADSIISADITICMADLNVDYLKIDSAEYKFLNSLFKNSFQLEHIITKPTRMVSGALLYHVSISQSPLVINCSVIDIPDFNSDYSLVSYVISPSNLNNN